MLVSHDFRAEIDRNRLQAAEEFVFQGYIERIEDRFRLWKRLCSREDRAVTLQQMLRVVDFSKERGFKSCKPTLGLP